MSALETTAESSSHKLARRSRHPSTASIHSTASTRSPRPSVWRPPTSLRVRKDSLSSGAPDPTISCVFAGAELDAGNRQGSVRDRMEAYNVQAAPVAGPSSLAVGAIDLSHEIEAIPEVEPDVTLEDKRANAADPIPIPDDSNMVAFPVSASPSTRRASSSSWFGSLSRAKGKEKLAEVQATTPASASAPNLLAPASESTTPIPEPAPVVPAASESTTPPAPERPDPFLLANAQPIAAQKTALAKRSWFSSSPVQPSPLREASPPQHPPPLPIRIPPPPFKDSPQSIPSSIDSSVPSPVVTPPADASTSFPLSDDGHATVRGRQRLASLNPSMGRFGLSLPLLGGGRASATATAVGVEDSTTTTTTSTYPAVGSLPATDPSVATTSASTADAPAASNAMPSGSIEVSSSRTEIIVQQSSSWWDYVGWGAADTSQPTMTEDEGDATPRPPAQSLTNAAEGDSVSQPNPALSESPVADDPDSKTLRSAPAISVSNADQVSCTRDNSGDIAPPRTDSASAPPRADFPLTAAQQRYWTSFFTSSYSTTITTSTASETTNAAVDGGTAKPDTTPTVSPDSNSPAAHDPPTNTSATSLSSNPIGESITSNRTGWVQPEVMYLDSDGSDDGEATDVAAAPTPQEGLQTKDEEPPFRPNGAASTGKPTAPSTKPAAPPLTISDSVKRQVANNGAVNSKRSSSPAPSLASKQSAVSSTGAKTPASKAPSIAPPRTPTPNLVLPTWADTFNAPPRSVIPQRLLDAHNKGVGRAVMEKTMKFVSGVLFASDSPASTRRSRSTSGAKGKGRERDDREQLNRFEEWGLGLPRAWDILKPAAGKRRGSSGESVGDAKVGNLEDVLRAVSMLWSLVYMAGAVMRSVLGEPTGTSTKFVNMMVQALEEFQSQYNVSLDKITRIPLEGEGTIDRRVEKLYTNLTSNTEWVQDLHAADVIFVATHSQGSVVSTHLLDKLIQDGHIRTGGPDVSKVPNNLGVATPSTSTGPSLPAPPTQRVCCLALCGIHLGPLRYLSSSSLLLPYIQYFESAAAKELFEFQNTESEVSKAYVDALRNVVDNGIKMVYVASLNDQVVPIYSGLFTAASHPLILRALYIDGDAYHSSDFLSNLLVLLLRVLNSGLPDSGLLAHLSEATAGSLNGVGHSAAYEELSTYSLAVKYLFLTNSGFDTHPKLTVEPFNANVEQNDYEIPWSLRDLIADDRVAHLFSREISELAVAFRHWHPKTTILRDIKRKLQPIQRLPSSFAAPTNPTSPASVSKL
ncbi:hypothetical protein B0H10DRAFT_1995412 [Mycena sp. CBHHK59/15]|nr:hypothetical protein B0H10DRAFT_1995412 [Mycena sp. CBHHK59/15]